MVRAMLSESLRAVISQSLLKTKDGSGRVAAHEIMIGTPAIRNLIRERKSFQIDHVIETHAHEGMITLNHSLAALVKKGEVSAETAMMYSLNPQELKGTLART